MLYAFINFPTPTPLPSRLVNGGLYTGEPAKGPWGNVPVEPSQYELSRNLLSASPPPNAEKQYIDLPRPGNNPDERHHYYTPYSSSTNPQLQCLRK